MRVDLRVRIKNLFLYGAYYILLFKLIILSLV